MRRIVCLAACLCAAQIFAQESPSEAAAQKGVEIPAVEAVAPSAAVLAAEEAIGKSDWKTAETKLDTWIAAHASDARALFDAGYVADEQNRLDAAAGFYRRATDANPKSLEAHLSLGLLLARQGKLAEARPELELTTTLDGGATGPALKARAWRALARIDRASNIEAATNDLLEALKISPETEDDTVFAAALAEQSGQLDAAEATYRRVLAQDAHSTQANAGLAHLLIRKKQYAEAETFLRAALEKSPDDPTLSAQLAMALAAQNKVEALPLLQKLHTAHLENAAITRMLAEVLAEAGDIASSDQLYVKLLTAAPEDASLLVAHGQNLVRLGHFSEAATAFTKATAQDAKNIDAWSGLAFAASRLQQPAVTLHALTERAALAPESASTYFLWATAYDALHKKSDAAAAYHHFIEAAGNKYADQVWQAKQRLQLLEK